MLVEKNPSIKLSISKTTRKPRPTEKDGVNYFFVSKEDFIKDIECGNLLEYAEYNNNFYGTPKDFVLSMLNCGYDVILEIETCGALKVKSNFKDAVLIFILPPSMDELYRRLKGRGTECEEEIQSRLRIAKNEIRSIDRYDYCVINDDVDEAVKTISNIIYAEKLRTKYFDVKNFLKE